MPDGNFVKIDRKILSWGWYTDPNTCHLFLHCVLRANWKPGEWKGVHYERGQFITSLASLSRDTGLSIQQVRTAIKHLELTGEITRTKTSKFTVITVKKYDMYQSDNRVYNKQPTSSQQGINRQPTTVQEGKNNKEIKEHKELSEETQKFIEARRARTDAFLRGETE